MKVIAVVAEDKAAWLLQLPGKETREVATIYDKRLRLGKEEEEGTWLVSNEEEEGINYNGCGYISWRGSRGRKKVRTVGIGAAGWGARRKMRAVVGGSTTTGCGLEVAASRSG
ncbi:hypothetical protein BHE74_00045329 [Ensete ventricosum]|nr:hypothetical protein BHE74_00045329 [Ensete ventricosum]RZR94445.1 hypothetical protein BHM03_00023129 [Ensete ventricosum]